MTAHAALPPGGANRENRAVTLTAPMPIGEPCLTQRRSHVILMTSDAYLSVRLPTYVVV